MTDALSEYPWSSHYLYQKGDAPAWLDIHSVKRIIKQKTGNSYDQFMKNHDDHNDWKPSMYLDEHGRVIIDDAIIQNACIENIPAKPNNKKLSPKDVGEFICNYLDIELSDLYSNKRSHDICKKRTIYVYFLLKYTELTISEVALRLQRSRSSLRRQLNTVEANSYVLLNEIEASIMRSLLD